MQTMTSLAKLCADAPGWAAAAPERATAAARAAPPLSFDGERYDVAVIGAGITGLIAGIRAARAGLRVAVFEAGEPGAGASGRNSGFVIPALSRASPAVLAQAWGSDTAARFGTTLAGAANALFAFVRDEGIVCDAQQTGWLQPDACEADAPALQARLAQLREAGVKAHLVERDALQAATGARRYGAALCLPEGGQLDPLALTRGLAATFVGSGGTLATHCPLLSPLATGSSVLASARGTDAPVRLDTPAGTVFARAVIVATNANGVGWPAVLHRATMPFALLLATFALPKRGAEHVLRSRQPLSDLNRDMWFFRRIDERHLLTGMFATRERVDIRRVEHALGARIESTFGVRADAMTGVWAGRVGLTSRGVPQLLQWAPNVYGWTGCNGRGIVLSFVMGEVLASLAGRTGSTRPLLTPRPFRPLPMRRAGASLARILIDADRRKRQRLLRTASPLPPCSTDSVHNHTAR